MNSAFEVIPGGTAAAVQLQQEHGFDLRRSGDLAKLNSLTKYPSIPTYHKLDPNSNGRLTEQHEEMPAEGLIFTEKIDGTNARIILVPGGQYLIGSREELLYAKGDIVGNPALGIVDALRPIADRLLVPPGANALVVVYGEVFGGKVTAASRQYSSERKIGFRVFDVAHIADYRMLLQQDIISFSTWREGNNSRFVNESTLLGICYNMEALSDYGTVPRLMVTAPLPQGVAETYEWLKQAINVSLCPLDSGAGRMPEGIVARTADRSKIVKIRFEDYRRTLRQGRKG
jgi:hypothetical protein